MTRATQAPTEQNNTSTTADHGTTDHVAVHGAPTVALTCTATVDWDTVASLVQLWLDEKPSTVSHDAISLIFEMGLNSEQVDAAYQRLGIESTQSVIANHAVHAGADDAATDIRNRPDFSGWESRPVPLRRVIIHTDLAGYDAAAIREAETILQENNAYTRRPTGSVTVLDDGSDE